MEKSEFQFEGFKINKSLFDLNKQLASSDLTINFKPSGKLDKVNSKFNLNLGVFISDQSNNLKIEVEAIGFFKFSIIDDKDLKNFLFLNAPAILFPYIRAYISTLTTLSGINPIVLPTLNMSRIKDDLIKEIEEVVLS